VALVRPTSSVSGRAPLHAFVRPRLSLAEYFALALFFHSPPRYFVLTLSSSVGLTLGMTGRANGTQSTIRDSISGLRCTRLLDSVVDNLLTCQFRHMCIFIMLDKYA
jgi:hypothetical protein